MNESGLNLEIEIKLELESFMCYLKLIGFLGAIDSEEQHLNGFFDTEDRQLAEAGWVLRVRAEPERGLVTLKSLSKQQGAAAVREELEAEIERSTAVQVLHLHKDIMHLAVPPVRYVRENFADPTLARLIQFTNTRQSKRFQLGDYYYNLEIDRTEFSDGSVDYELEVELKEVGQIEVVQNQLQRMFNSLDIPFIPQEKSKFERALMRANLA